MIFYRFEEGRIGEHWIQMNMQDIVGQFNRRVEVTEHGLVMFSALGP